MLQRDGYAWGSAKLNKRGTKNTGIEIEIKRVLTAYDEHADKAVSLIREALQRKGAKTYSPDTEIIVMFEENIIVRDAGADDLLNKFFEQEVRNMELMFRRVYFVGWSKETYLACDLQ